ncbi:MAG: hypothetical protein GXZ13_01050 [Synergistaceae bacterium]|nr:hypothetical protein [Synergistaceae bacterium]
MPKVKFYFNLIFIVLLLCIFPLSAIANIQEEGLLPKIEGWKNEDLRISKLEAVSGNKGIWLEREYKNPDGKIFYATRIDGNGVKSWDINEEITAVTSDGPIGSGATYKIVKLYVKQFPNNTHKTNYTVYTAAVNYHPLTGISIVTKLNLKSTLTLETKNATEAELIKAASTIIENMK